MKLQKLLLSKLIQACEMDWIPEADAIYGEPTFTKTIPEGLKPLIYKRKRRNVKAKEATNKLDKFKSNSCINI